jgi:hypothetical protein
VNAKLRINQLKKWAARYTKIYNRIYKDPNPPSQADRNEFEFCSAEIEDFLACDTCGSGGIEDAMYVLEHPEEFDCKDCVELVKLWEATPEVHCYTWSI